MATKNTPKQTVTYGQLNKKGNKGYGNGNNMREKATAEDHRCRSTPTKKTKIGNEAITHKPVLMMNSIFYKRQMTLRTKRRECSYS